MHYRGLAVTEVFNMTDLRNSRSKYDSTANMYEQCVLSKDHCVDDNKYKLFFFYYLLSFY